MDPLLKAGGRQRRETERIWHGRGESERLSKYDAYLKGFPKTLPGQVVRRTWDLDVTGLSTCWHTTALEIEQYSCEHLPAGGVVCRIALQSPFKGEPPVMGIVAVTAPLWSKLLRLPKSQRDDAVWRRLTAYVCGIYPKETFACELIK